MENTMKCICRNKRNFKVCKKYSKKNSVFCKNHANENIVIYKIYNKIFGTKTHITMNDIYNLYKYITDNINEIDYEEEKPGFLFIEMLKIIPYKILLLICKKYLQNKKYKKKEIYEFLHELNEKTYKISNKHKINIIQDKYKFYLLSRDIDSDAIINTEDLFSCEDINSIPNNRLFIIKDINGCYAFDVVELDFFIKTCKDEEKEPYNPYTRTKLSDDIIWKLGKFIEYNNIIPRELGYRWDNNMHAFTDLSIELERRGFYNSPEWLNKMSIDDILKTVKYFKDFSLEIEESNNYFNNISDNNTVFDFCKEGIKMLKECKEDLYILCCNFMKSLAMRSNDFYDNIPTWMSGINTTSLLSDVFSIFNNNYTESPNNFLLYYYVEYM